MAAVVPFCDRVGVGSAENPRGWIDDCLLRGASAVLARRVAAPRRERNVERRPREAGPRKADYLAQAHRIFGRTHLDIRFALLPQEMRDLILRFHSLERAPKVRADIAVPSPDRRAADGMRNED